MERHERTRESRQPRFSLSQETITVLTIGIAIIGINLAHMAEIRSDRARLEESMNQMRARGWRNAGKYAPRGERAVKHSRRRLSDSSSSRER